MGKMAPARLSTPTYNTRRKKQISARGSTSTAPDVVGSSPCSPGAAYANGCDLHLMHDDADDILNDAIAAGKEGHEEDDQEYNRDASERETSFSSPGTVRCTASRETTAESKPLPTQMEQIFERLRSTPLCTRQTLATMDAGGSQSLERSNEEVRVGLLTAKCPPGEHEPQQERTSPKASSGHKDLTHLQTEGLCGQHGDPLSVEQPSEKQEKRPRGASVPGRAEAEAASEIKSPGVEPETLEVHVQTGNDNEMKRPLCALLPEGCPLSEDAGDMNDASRIAKKRRCSALSGDPAPGEDPVETRDEEAPRPVPSPREDAAGEDCSKNNSKMCQPLLCNAEVSAEGANPVCRLVSGEDVERKQDLVKLPIFPKEEHQRVPADLEGAVPPPAAHVNAFVAAVPEDVARPEEGETVMQQNSSTLVKRRRCGSLGLDQSLRWQAMARRVPRIKGVCYSTTRHEWIAVGPLQAGSARKKNIYFSVPKHGFDGARRLAVECRRRLQAGVPVNVPEFVREQQLLYQRETTTSKPAEGGTSLCDAGSMIKEPSSVATRPSVGCAPPGAPESLPRKPGASTRGHVTVSASPAQENGHPRSPSAATGSGRRRQRLRGPSYGPLQRELGQRLLHQEGEIREVPKEGREQRRVPVPKDAEAREASHSLFSKGRWRDFAGKTSFPRAPTAGEERVLRGSGASACVRDKTVSAAPVAHNRSATDSQSLPVMSRANPSLEADAPEASFTRAREPYVCDRERNMDRACSNEDPAFSIAARLAIIARRTGLLSDESAATGACPPLDALTSDILCRCSTLRSLQLWASALEQTTHVDGQGTAHTRLCTGNAVASALSALLNQTRAEKNCTSPGTRQCFPPAIARSVSFDSRPHATPTERHPFRDTGCVSKQAKNGGAALQQRGDASFPASDYYARRSSTSSSAGSRSAALPRLTETTAEHTQSSSVPGEVSNDSVPKKDAFAEKLSAKLSPRESCSLDSRSSAKVPDVEQRQLGTGRCPAAGNRRFSTGSPSLQEFGGAHMLGEITAAEISSNESSGPQSLVDLLQPVKQSTDVDLTNPRGGHVCNAGDDFAPRGKEDGNAARQGSKRAGAAAALPDAPSAGEDTRASRTDKPEGSTLQSLLLGKASKSPTTPACPASPDYSCPSTLSFRSEQATGVYDTPSGRTSPHQQTETAGVGCQEPTVLDDANVQLQRSEAAAPALHAGDGACAPLARQKEEERGEEARGNEKPGQDQPEPGEVAILVKAVCVMLVDLLRFCSCSPLAMMRAGLQPPEVTFCKTEGGRVLRTALQDVSATVSISPRFRVYLEMFEDAILANALPTSGSAADVLRYLQRLKQLTEGRSCLTGHADTEKPVADTGGGATCAGVLVGQQQTQPSPRCKDKLGAGDQLAVRRSDSLGNETTRCRSWSEAVAAHAQVDGPQKSSSHRGQENDRTCDPGKTAASQCADGDMGSLLNVPIEPAIGSWSRTQRRAEQEVEERRCASEKDTSRQSLSISQRRCTAPQDETASRCTDVSQPDADVHTAAKGRSSSCPTSVLGATDNTRGGPLPQKRQAACYADGPDSAGGAGVSVEKAAESVGGQGFSSNKTHKGHGEVTAGTFWTWRQLVIEALQELKSFEDLRRSEAMKQLLSFCFPVPPTFLLQQQ